MNELQFKIQMWFVDYYPRGMGHAETVEVLGILTVLHGQKAVAHALGFSPQYINDVVRGKRKLSEKMLKALGLRAVTTYLPEVNP